MTYRIYDYDRGRDLHIDKAVAVTDLTPSDAPLTPQGEPVEHDGYTLTVMADCEYFNLKRIGLHGSYPDKADETSFVSLVVTAGKGVYTAADGSIDLRFGDSLFVPAGKGDFTLTGEAEILRTTV